MIRIATAIAATLLASSALASEPVATLSAQEGTVLVNQGEEFATAAEGQALQAGDRVMLMEGASATLTFADGCALPLEAGSLLEVPAVSTCAGAVANVQKIGPTYAQAVGSRARDNDGAVLVFTGVAAVIVWDLMSNDFSITDPPPAPPISP
ncbi:MAG: hypothetical protein ABS41_07460 [Arenimonas sp. SCN 70-307]|uniref:hypothetical protein n=1 Tax=Arenimonas sp. SCN 70-307 TaxID=1660089 RepID=UPI000869AF91|nr:hypothetical protein [Arenimonas sp. SCN 70-307]ODS63001.1 MAG: hypothetical protein ABS41_07460 [Arenimonas sp. SCN 70-307]